MRYVYTVNFSTWDGCIETVTVDLKDYYYEYELDNKPDCELMEMVEECAWNVAYEEDCDVADIIDIIQG